MHVTDVGTARSWCSFETSLPPQPCTLGVLLCFVLIPELQSNILLEERILVGFLFYFVLVFTPGPSWFFFPLQYEAIETV